ncbi:MAG: hypothetical protein ACF8TS_11940 [Maioricimonas sp. JB049]
MTGLFSAILADTKGEFRIGPLLQPPFPRKVRQTDPCFNAAPPKVVTETLFR